MQHLLSFLAAVAAVKASPFPQGVTQAIAPPGGMPTGCAASHKGMFGIAVISGTSSLGATQAADGQPAAATQISDGQPQAPAVNQISDGQVQAMTQIADGQIQAPLPTCAASQISDGQVQGCMMPTPTGAAVSQIGDGQPQAPTGAAVSQIGDGQPQAPTGAAVSQIGDGQPQAPTGAAVSQIGDGQPQAPTGAAAASQISDGQVQATGASQMGDGQVNSGASAGSGSGMTACMSDGTLELTLMDGILHDAQGRTGYIAANYQFQFDAPAQAGAIYTAGWSLCEGGVLALGMNTTFYRCRSGDFYNLYNENWAPQCEPVTIRAVDLVSC